MKIKSRKYIYIWLCVIVLVLLAGITLAYFFTSSEKAINSFTKAEVSCTVDEVFDGNEKTSVRVQNTGNISSYLRVRLSSHWVNSEGKTIAKLSPELSPDLAEGWFAAGDNTYCYSRPVEPGGFTPDLLNSPLVLKSDANTFQVVEVFAEAIQAEPAAAVAEAWNVSAAQDGTLTGN